MERAKKWSGLVSRILFALRHDRRAIMGSAGDHLSRPTVARRLMRPTRDDETPDDILVGRIDAFTVPSGGS